MSDLLHLSELHEISHPKRSLREKAKVATSKRCNTLICVLENPTNMNNVAAIVRTVHCLGVAKCYIIDSDMKNNETWNKDIRLNPHWMAASCSAIKWTYVRKFSSTEDCLAHLKKNNYTSIVTSPHIKGKQNIELSNGNYTDKKLAVWFGNETVGISFTAVEAADRCIQIPMSGIVESLNLSVSAGIVLYEITQQRRKYRQQLNHS